MDHFLLIKKNLNKNYHFVTYLNYYYNKNIYYYYNNNFIINFIKFKQSILILNLYFLNFKKLILNKKIINLIHF